MHEGSAPLDELYLQWLYKQVADPGFEDRTLTFWKIFKVLFEKEFVWIVPNDENRIGDGKALRIAFCEEMGFSEVDGCWIELGCSMLELMVGLAKRLEEEALEGKAHYWFWAHLMENIGLSRMNDKRRFTKKTLEMIDDILETIIYRTYNSSGLGGFFPLIEPQHDQREREIWYQLNDYILEQSPAG